MSNKKKNHFNEDEVRFIRREYLLKRFRQTELAKKFNVSSVSINKIINFISYPRVIKEEYLIPVGKPYLCLYCNNFFSSMRNRNKHLTKYHKKDEVMYIPKPLKISNSSSTNWSSTVEELLKNNSIEDLIKNESEITFNTNDFVIIIKKK